MKAIRLLSLLLCGTMSIGMMAQSLSIVTSPQVLPPEVNKYSAKGISGNGRYVYGGWSNPIDVSFLYDLETQKAQIFEADDRDGIRIVKALSDGSVIYVYRPRGECKAYLRTPEGKEIPLQAPNLEDGLFPTDASDDGKYIVANAQILKEWRFIPMLGVRQEDGSYRFTALPEPDEDLFGMKPQSNKVESLTPDAKILVGRQNGYSGMEMQVIKWVRQEDGSYRYSLPLEGFFANADQPKPGPAPKYEDFVTADPNTDPDAYDEQNKAYDAAHAEWQEKFNNRLGKWITNFMHVTHFSSQTKKYCTSVKTIIDDHWSLIKPIIWDVQTDEYKLLEVSDDLGDMQAYDYLYDGSILCVSSSPGTICWTPYALNPETLELKPFYTWLKEHTGTDISDFYKGQKDPMTGNMTMGIPSISSDGRTIMFHTMNTDEQVGTEFFNTYIRLSGNIFTANSPLPDAPALLDYYFDGEALVDRSATVAQKSLRLYDTSGSCVYTTGTSQSRIPLPTSLPKGTYIAQITSEEGSVATLSCLLH